MSVSLKSSRFGKTYLFVKGKIVLKEKIFTVSNLQKTYESGAVKNNVIENFDLDIYEKDFTVIMGPSGSGKSTLLYCLGAMESITNGEIIFENEDISKLKNNALSELRLNKFGFIFQQIHLVSNLTLLENVVLPGLAGPNRTNNSVYEDANNLLKRFGISEAANRLPSQVSGGEQQRAAIARALINQPIIIFADEPTGALNQNNSQIVMDLFSELNNSGQTIVLVTHDKRAALRANRIIYIIDGSIVSELNLDPYQASNLQEREDKVNEWLVSMEW
ncbi:MAG TPA: ABC transporter ATP-binding protein [Clostridiaceae bacterium]|nr:ABC transporter ATP-binding protein [Clostridiaceae bacterium]